MAKIIESASNKYDIHKIPFIFMNYQLYFILIGAKEMRMKNINL